MLNKRTQRSFLIFHHLLYLFATCVGQRRMKVKKEMLPSKLNLVQWAANTVSSLHFEYYTFKLYAKWTLLSKTQHTFLVATIEALKKQTCSFLMLSIKIYFTCSCSHWQFLANWECCNQHATCKGLNKSATIALNALPILCVGCIWCYHVGSIPAY